MKTLITTVFFAVLLALSPVAAQVVAPSTSNGQQSAGQAGQSTSSQAPTTGVICMEEMTATFCNVVTGPSSGGYGSSGGSGSGGGSASGGGPASNTSSIPPCSTFPPANELCN
jgi:opacity protein-like surface antigen